jgi:hypothetical protein
MQSSSASVTVVEEAGSPVAASLLVAPGAPEAFPVWRGWVRGAEHRIRPRRMKNGFGASGWGRSNVWLAQVPLEDALVMQLEIRQNGASGTGQRHTFLIFSSSLMVFWFLQICELRGMHSLDTCSVHVSSSSWSTKV